MKIAMKPHRVEAMKRVAAALKNLEAAQARINPFLSSSNQEEEIERLREEVSRCLALVPPG